MVEHLYNHQQEAPVTVTPEEMELVLERQQVAVEQDQPEVIPWVPLEARAEEVLQYLAHGAQRQAQVLMLVALDIMPAVHQVTELVVVQLRQRVAQRGRMRVMQILVMVAAVTAMSEVALVL
jgi:hypothetical protein